MNPCTQLSDRMPAVAQGGSRWTAAEEGHLRGCPECSWEWRVVRGAAGLGQGLDRSIDPSGIADRVLVSLRAPAPKRAWSRHASWAVPMAIAASLLLVLVRPRGQEAVRDESGVALSLLPEAESLSDSELESVIRLIPVADPAEVGVDSLTDEELTEMLQDLEG